MTKKLSPDRLLYILNAGMMTFAMIMNIKVAIPYASVIPYMNLIKAGLNAFCVCLSIILIVHPQKKLLTYIVFFVEAGNAVLVGFMGIGTSMFCIGIILCFVNGEFAVNRRKKVILLGVYWLLVTITIYPVLGFTFVIFEILGTLFGLTACAALYQKLEGKLSYLLLPNETVTTAVTLPPKGSTLKLSDYELSERQIAFILGSIKHGETYETLGNRYYVSTSVVKKDMAAACKYFGVANREALRILLLQYKLE
ncbi:MULTISPECIES: hypothetical protein [unclassified Treponema]|uniref:hypothetical protein n=1 Tax=unclassified Treponema TaxID=2638727 RepID=UPI00053011F9|nr:MULTISPECIES: hypothetical protein [unclassified Treponema]AIW90166.1 hypothetical protein JO41_10470 [Treponema sp. OMZ 838]